MGITNSNKVLSTDRIPCGGTFNVTLSLTAEPSIVSNPVDVVLILDRSQSMAAHRWIILKRARYNSLRFSMNPQTGARMDR